MGIFSSSLTSDTNRHQDLLQRQLTLHNVLLTSAQSKCQNSLAMTHMAIIERLVKLIVGNDDSKYSAAMNPTKRHRAADDAADDDDVADNDDVADDDAADDDADFEFSPNYGCPKRFCHGIGRRGAVDFDLTSEENAEQLYAEENMYKEERRADRKRVAENGHGFVTSESFDADSDTDDSFVVSDELVDFEDFKEPEFECDDESEFECDDSW